MLYWDYATASDSAPSWQVPPGTDMANGSANFYQGSHLMGSPCYSTPVGAYTGKPSTSAYGTYDQGGNIYEWNETLIGSLRGLRGGSWFLSAAYLPAFNRNSYSPTRHTVERPFRPHVILLAFCPRHRLSGADR